MGKYLEAVVINRITKSYTALITVNREHVKALHNK